jgi:hypothetical protein
MEESHGSSMSMLSKPGGDKILFENKALDSPIMWLRIDPDLEYIRKIKGIMIML